MSVTKKISILLLLLTIAVMFAIPSIAQDGHGSHGATDATEEATEAPHGEAGHGHGEATEAPHGEAGHDGHEEMVNCESMELASQVAEHLAVLDNIATLLMDDSDAGLAAIYEAGVALQMIAETCGYQAVIGDAANGEILFTTMNETGFACATCHLVNTTDRLIGPGLLGIGDPNHDPSSHATDSSAPVVPRPDLTPVEYIRQSIMTPNAYVVPTFPENLMPQIYGEIFTEEQINDIIAYLLTLEHTDH